MLHYDPENPANNVLNLFMSADQWASSDEQAQRSFSEIKRYVMLFLRGCQVNLRADVFIVSDCVKVPKSTLRISNSSFGNRL